VEKARDPETPFAKELTASHSVLVAGLGGASGFPVLRVFTVVFLSFHFH